MWSFYTYFEPEIPHECYLLLLKWVFVTFYVILALYTTVSSKLTLFVGEDVHFFGFHSLAN